MKKFLISFYKYRNDQWNDLENIVTANNEEEALTLFKNDNRLARDITIKEYGY
jgi:hypothetical protein